MTETPSTPGLAPAALDSLLDPCVIVWPLRDATDAVVDLIVTDANRAAAAYHGVARRELLGRRVAQMLRALGDVRPFDECVRVIETGEQVMLLDYVLPAPGNPEHGVLVDLRLAPIDGGVAVCWRDSAVRREHEDVLARSERRFRILAEHASDVVVETDGDGEIVWVSTSVTDVLGFAPDAWLGRTLRELVVPSDVERIMRLGQEAVGAGSGDAVECRFVTATDESRWMSARSRPIRDRDAIVGTVVALRDIQDAVTLRRAVTTLSSANEILVRAASEDELLLEMCEVAVNHAGYLFAWYGRAVDDDEKSVHAVASSAERREYLDEIRVSWGDGPLGQGPTGTCLRTGTAQVVNDFRREVRYRPWIVAAGERSFRSSLSLPVFVDGVLDGALMVYAPEVNAFDEQAVAVMDDLARQVGYGIGKLRNSARLTRALDDARLLRTAIDQAAEAILVTDPDGTIRYGNPAVFRTTGFARDEVLGQNPRIFQSGLHDPRFYEDMWKRILGGQAWHGVMMNRRKDGVFYEEEATIAPVHDADGRRIAFVAVKHDLSRERSLEAVVDRDRSDRDVIVSLMREVRAGDTLEATAGSLCSAVEQFDHIDGAVVFMLDGTHRATPIALSGLGLPSRQPVGRALSVANLPALIERCREGAWWMDLHGTEARAIADPTFLQGMLERGVTATAYAPIRWDGETIGVLSIATRSRTVEEWMPRRLGMLTEVGSFAGMLLGPQAVERGRKDRVRAALLDIIENERFRTVYEPVIHLPSGIPVGYEALTRFDDGERPDRRFAEAHAVGLGSDLETVCARMALRGASSLPPTSWLSVNFSPATILEGRAGEVLAEAGRQVIIEITEHNAIENYAAVRYAIDQCGEVLVAVDDAGAGFASLRHILELQPDIIKLDLALVRDIDVDPARQALAAGLRHFAALTGTILIAEGVETEAEAKAVRQLGVELAQGYLFQQQSATP